MTHDHACAYQHAPDSQVHIQQQRNKSNVLKILDCDGECICAPGRWSTVALKLMK